MGVRRELLTIGHSTHPAERFLRLLRASGAELLVDVRRYPASRRNPQFDAAALEASLRAEGIEYVALGEQLGGRRGSGGAQTAAAASFAAYAEHMRTAEFAAGIERLEELAAARRTAIMCAEGDWRRCHRRLIADALVERGWRVVHILPDGRVEHPTPLV